MRSTFSELGGQRGESVRLSPGIAVLDEQVLALDVAELTQPLPEGGKEGIGR